MNRIKADDESAPNIILTTMESAIGINFYKKCTPVMTIYPQEYDEYLQILGRSNRENYRGEKKAIILTDNLYLDISSLEFELR